MFNNIWELHFLWWVGQCGLEWRIDMTWGTQRTSKCNVQNVTIKRVLLIKSLFLFLWGPEQHTDAKTQWSAPRRQTQRTINKVNLMFLWPAVAVWMEVTIESRPESRYHRCINNQETAADSLRWKHYPHGEGHGWMADVHEWVDAWNPGQSEWCLLYK